MKIILMAIAFILNFSLFADEFTENDFNSLVFTLQETISSKQIQKANQILQNRIYGKTLTLEMVKKLCSLYKSFFWQLIPAINHETLKIIVENCTDFKDTKESNLDFEARLLFIAEERAARPAYAMKLLWHCTSNTYATKKIIKQLCATLEFYSLEQETLQKLRKIEFEISNLKEPILTPELNKKIKNIIDEPVNGKRKAEQSKKDEPPMKRFKKEEPLNNN